MSVLRWNKAFDWKRMLRIGNESLPCQDWKGAVLEFIPEF
jgi:hypothetical protein